MDFRHGLMVYDSLHSFFSSWSDPAERFDSTRKKLAHFPWSHSMGWLDQPRIPGKGPHSSYFPAFCLFELLVFERQLSSFSKDNSI